MALRQERRKHLNMRDLEMLIRRCARVGAAGLFCFVIPFAARADDTVTNEPPPVLEQIDAYIATQTVSGAICKTNVTWRQHLPVFPPVRYPVGHEYSARVETEKGVVIVKLLHGAAPRHVANFLYLARLGFYDGEAFDFVVPGKRVQWGCPIGDGRGTPGYVFAGEYESGLSHDRPGLLSTANAGRNTDGCIFFFTLSPMPWFDGKHTIFGEVTNGIEVLTAVGETGTPLGQPRSRVKIARIALFDRTGTERNPHWE
jgi:peptidylprolyl isomerase